jgi:hypothetical protein
MIKKLLAAWLSMSVVCAILTSALALAELQQDPVAQKFAEALKEPGDTAKQKPADAPANRKTETKEVSKPVLKAYIKVAPAVKGAVAPAPPRKGMNVRRRGVPMNLDAQVQQFTQQFRPILRAEYHVVRAVCQLTLEQRKQIARDAENALKDVAQSYVEAMQRPMTAAERTAREPRTLIQDALFRAVKARLTANQAARYQEELARRSAGRKQLAVRNLVARLDNDLVLSSAQRDQISQSLSSHWDDSWAQSLEMFLYDYGFIPPIPDQLVAPFLNEVQKKAWWSTRKQQVFFGGFGMMGGFMEEDPFEDDELREARMAQAKNENQGEHRAPAHLFEMMKVQLMEQVQRVRREAAVKVEAMEQLQHVQRKAAVKVEAKAKE